jgi:sulfur-carrier protein
VKVRLFARARELAGRDEIVVEAPAGVTVAALRDAIAEQVPALASFARRCAVAVGGAYAVEGEAVAEGAEVALIPPVSGGAKVGSMSANPQAVRLRTEKAQSSGDDALVVRSSAPFGTAAPSSGR